MYVVCICIDTHTHTCMHTYIHAYMHVHNCMEYLQVFDARFFLWLVFTTSRYVDKTDMHMYVRMHVYLHRICLDFARTRHVCAYTYICDLR
jgi:hypothetical protein